MSEFLTGTAILLTYHLVAVFALPLAVSALTPLPLEVVRKAQHVAYALSVFLLLGLFEHWYVAVVWGGLGPDWRPIVAAAAMIWGFGDAAAALVGKLLGRRRVVHRAIEGAKTYEGTGAMIAAGAAATFLTLLLYGGAPWWISLGAAALVAPLAGVVELFSRRGLDTLAVPLVSAAALVPWWLLVVAWGG